MSDKEKVSGEEVEVVACRHSETGRSTADPVQDIARQLGIQTFGDGLLAKIRQTIDLLQEAAAERDQLRAEVERLTQEKANWVKWSKQLDAQLAQQQVPDGLRDLLERVQLRIEHDGCPDSLAQEIRDWLAAAPAPVQAEPSSPWVAVSERLPENGVPVIVYCSGAECSGVAWIRQGAWLMPEPQAMGYETITHWMPLPKSPEAGQ